MADSPGMVSLIGAGPGDPGLITVAGLERLRGAEAVVYDRLVHPALLAEAPRALLIDVGKRPDHHPVPQDEINQVLIEHARAGRRVVRLKGGDPFVFGRGGEETEALARAGIPFEIIPGVTSAVAVPAYAGIPVTHRDLACSFSVITGHRKADREGEIACDWQRAAGADTLIFLMGVTALPDIVANLIAIGRSPVTPAAVIERGTFGDQRTVTGTLATIAEAVAEARIHPPATLVVGEVVALRGQLGWFDSPDRRPLRGLRVLNTRSLQDGEALSRQLAALGAETIALPATEIGPAEDPTPLDRALAAIAERGPDNPAFDWIGFTSKHAVHAFMARLFQTRAKDRRSMDARDLAGIQLAAVGPATGDALRGYGLVPDLTPDRSTGRHLAAALGDVAGQHFLLPRSDIALPDLPDALRARGATVTEVVVYVTRPATANPVSLGKVLKGEVDAVCFFSPSAVDGLAAQVAPRPLADVLGRAVAVCVGETTAKAARDRGLADMVVAEEASPEGVVRALVARLNRVPQR